MSKEHIELIQRGFELLAKGEMFWESLDEHVEIHDYDVPDRDVYRGHEGFGLWLENWSSAWSEYTFELEKFVDGGEVVVAVIRLKATGRSSGVTVERQDALVYKFRDGRIASLDYYNSKEQALEAAGLTE